MQWKLLAESVAVAVVAVVSLGLGVLFLVFVGLDDGPDFRSEPWVVAGLCCWGAVVLMFRGRYLLAATGLLVAATLVLLSGYAAGLALPCVLLALLAMLTQWWSRP